jgi:hypothetical protein
MLYALSFAPEFFWGTVPVEKVKPNSRPTFVYQAVLSLTKAEWDNLARDVFHCPPDNLDVETVMAKIKETNTCANLDPPVDVFIDADGWYRVRVYEA